MITSPGFISRQNCQQASESFMPNFDFTCNFPRLLYCRKSLSLSCLPSMVATPSAFQAAHSLAPPPALISQ